jgi:polysaccharide biosynthesis transport protein
MYNDAAGVGGMTPQFFGTEFEKIKSRNSLMKVVENLELVNRWNVDKETALRILKGIVSTQNIRGTDLISIRVRHTSKVDARDVTDEVAKAYRAYRSEIESGDAERQLHELNKAVRDQEDKVEERRKVLATIVRTKGIIYKGTDSFYGQSGVDEDQGAKNALQTFHQLEQDKMQLESQISSLLKYDSDQLMVYASGLDLPDNIIRSLLPEYQAANRQFKGLKISGLGPNHPTVRAAADQIERMKRQLDEGVVNLRATLKAQLDLALTDSRASR